MRFNPNFRVVSEKELNEKWVDVPGYPNHKVNEQGEVVRRHLTWGRWYVSGQFEVPTSKGTYLYCTDITQKNKLSRVAVHQLVCKAYHPYPQDGQKYEPNHKDGDKHNNHKDNLEWVTRRENCLHAINTGLRKDNVVITVEDLETGEKKDYSSINQLSLDWSIPRHALYALIGRHKETPYQGRYKFHYDPATLHQVNRKLARKVMAWDYVNQCWLTADSVNGLALATGVLSPSISHQIRQRSSKPCAGYLFRELGDTQGKPDLDPQQAQRDRQQYWNNPIEEKTWHGVVCYDHVTQKELLFASRKEASKALGISAARISSFINEDRCQMLNGYTFKNEGDETPIPEFTPIQAWLSRNGYRLDTKVFDVTHSEKNTTERFIGKKALASYFGYDSSKGHIVDYLQDRLDKDFPNYQITLVN